MTTAELHVFLNTVYSMHLHAQDISVSPREKGMGEENASTYADSSTSSGHVECVARTTDLLVQVYPLARSTECGYVIIQWDLPGAHRISLL
jgi:hypothetical protein